MGFRFTVPRVFKTLQRAVLCGFPHHGPEFISKTTTNNKRKLNLASDNIYRSLHMQLASDAASMGYGPTSLITQLGLNCED